MNEILPASLKIRKEKSLIFFLADENSNGWFQMIKSLN